MSFFRTPLAPAQSKAHGLYHGRVAGLPWTEEAGEAGGGLKLLNFRSGTFTRSSVATYQTGPSTVASAATNELRYENRGGVLYGFLLEPGSTNVLTVQDPVDVSVAGGWVLNNGSGNAVSTAAASTSPMGGLTGATLYTEGGDFLRTANLSLAASTAHTFTVWARGALGTETMTLHIYDNVAGQQDSGTFNLTTSWARYRYTATTGAGITTSQVRIRTPNVGAQTMHLWGAHPEALPYPTSLITTAGATRAADTLTVSSIPERMQLGKYSWTWIPLGDSTELTAAQTRPFDSGGASDDRLQYSPTPTFNVVLDGITQLNRAVTWSELSVLTQTIDWDNREVALAGYDTGNDSGLAIGGAALHEDQAYRIGGVYSGTNEFPALYREPVAA